MCATRSSPRCPPSRWPQRQAVVVQQSLSVAGRTGNTARLYYFSHCRSFLIPIFMMVVLFVIQNWSGFIVVIFFAANIFKVPPRRTLICILATHQEADTGLDEFHATIILGEIPPLLSSVSLQPPRCRPAGWQLSRLCRHQPGRQGVLSTSPRFYLPSPGAPS